MEYQQTNLSPPIFEITAWQHLKQFKKTKTYKELQEKQIMTVYYKHQQAVGMAEYLQQNLVGTDTLTGLTFAMD